MLRTLVASTVAAFVFALNVTVANAQMVCGERAKFLEYLGDKTFREAPTSIGMTSNGQVIEVLTSSEGTWTIMMTRPDGMSPVSLPRARPGKR